METQYNLRSPSVKRLMKEAAELKDPTELFFAQPLEDNLFEWHFTIRGPPDTEFDGGIYHGRIILPAEYPMKPPSIMLLTANGRFELNKKICLSISGYHPESWQPSWSIRTALLAIIGFMPTDGKGAIGALDYSPEERKTLAKHSREWRCKTCGNQKLSEVLPALSDAGKDSVMKEAQELAKQLVMKESTEKSPIPRNSSITSTSNLDGSDYGSSHRIHQSETTPAGLDSMNVASSDGDSGHSIHGSSKENSNIGLRKRNVAVEEETGGVPASDQSQAASVNNDNSISQSTIPNNNGGRTDTRATPAPVINNGNSRPQHDGITTMTSFMMTIVSVMILALLLRRWYLMNEYRFNQSSESGGGDL